jgi:hypothetical protein
VAGRKPKLNWTPCYDQYTVTSKGTLHRLGKDEDEAQKQFRFLMRQAELGVEADPELSTQVVLQRVVDAPG